MKKLSIFIALLLMFSLLAVPAFAAQTATMTVTASNISADRGDTFTVTVSTSSIDNCAAGGFMFSYDENAFEYVSGTALITGFNAAGISTINNNLAGYFMAPKVEGTSVSGNLFQVTLKVKDDAAFGDYTITGVPNVNDGAVACSVVDAVITVACNHDMQETEAAVDATCTTAGKTAVYTCSKCGNTEGGEEIAIDPEAHNYVDGTCACGATQVLTDSKLVIYKSNASGATLQLGDDIRAVFQVKTVAGYDKIILRVTKNGVTTDNESITSGTWLKYTYVVPAAHMTMNCEVTVIGIKDGVEYHGETIDFTIRNCAETMMGNWYANYNTNANAAKQCHLAMNMLHYGAEAQKAFHVNEDYLATDGLSDEYLALITTTEVDLGADPVDDTTSMPAKLYNTTAQLQEKVKMVGIFSISKNFTAAEDYYIEIQHTKSKDGSVATYRIYSDEFELSGTKTRYIKFVFDKIAPSQMRDDMIITLYQNGEAVSITYNRTMCMIIKKYTANYPTLIPAIMNYADSAKNLFG